MGILKVAIVVKTNSETFCYTDQRSDGDTESNVCMIMRTLAHCYTDQRSDGDTESTGLHTTA